MTNYSKLEQGSNSRPQSRMDTTTMNTTCGRRRRRRRRRCLTTIIITFLLFLLLVSAETTARSSSRTSISITTAPTNTNSATTTTTTTTTTTSSTPTSRTKFKGTRMTGAGSSRKKNKSIFLSNSSNINNNGNGNGKNKKKHDLKKSLSIGQHDDQNGDNEIVSPMKGRLYTKITKKGELLLLFPNSHDNDNDHDEQPNEENGSIVSLSMNEKYNYFGEDDQNYINNNNCNQPSFEAKFWNEHEHNDDDRNRKRQFGDDDDDDHHHHHHHHKTMKRKKKRSKKKYHHKATTREEQVYYGHDIYSTTQSTSSKTSSSAKKKTHNLSKKWIPIEGIYGIYNLPSGPYLVLITDSELIYKSPRKNGHTRQEIHNHEQKQQQQQQQQQHQHPLIHLRRIKSIELIPLPYSYKLYDTSSSSSSKEKRFRQKLIKAEQNQLQLLRQSFKEHDFYYSFPLLQQQQQPSSSSSNDLILQDVTHTMQRFFEHYMSNQSIEEEEEERMEKMKESIFLNDYLNLHSSSISSMVVSGILNDNHIQKNAREYNDDNAKKIEKEFEPIVLQGRGGRSKSLSTKLFTSNKNDDDDDDVGKACRVPLSYLLLQNESGKSNKTHIIQSWWASLVPYKSDHKSIRKEQLLAPDTRFFWNEECVNVLLKALLHHNDNDDDDDDGGGNKTIHDKNNNSKMTCLRTSPYNLLLDRTIPVTSAFVGVQKNIELLQKAGKLPSVKYDQLLISRRSKYRAGTRFTKRGADGIGDVANFAETEQLCIFHNNHDNNNNNNNNNNHNNHNNDKNNNDVNKSQIIIPSNKNNRQCLELYSHVQTRGSIPLRWSSPTDIKTYRPKVLIGTDPLAQARALRNHLLEQMSKYSSNSPTATTTTTTLAERNVKLEFVNLIDKHSDQGRLGRTFSAVLDAVLGLYEKSESHNVNECNNADNDVCTRSLSKSSVSHIWFDFHAECRKGRWHRLQNLLDEVLETLDNQGYFHAVLSSKNGSHDGLAIHKLQNGVVRTNCMDCLDRTNVVQSMFGRYILFRQFSQRTDPKRVRKLPLEYVIGFKKDMLKLPWKNGEASHRLLWADNADAISRLYAGTPALKGDFTRTGKRTKRGALDDGLNSVTRFYLNNFLDADRQKGIDLLTGFGKFDVAFDKRPVIRKDSMRAIYSSRDNIVALSSKESKLNLGWLPGDLEGHLRSAAMVLDETSIENETSTLSLQKALIDICRRTSLDNPWWVDEETEEMLLLESSSEKIQSTRIVEESSSGSINSGHLIGGLIALQKAPLATIVAILCFLVPINSTR